MLLNFLRSSHCNFSLPSREKGAEALDDSKNKLIEDDEITADMILVGAKKARKIYLKAKNGKVMVLVMMV